MTPKVQQTFHDLVAALDVAFAQKCAAGIVGPEEKAPVTALIKALKNQSFHYEAELWHSTKDSEYAPVFPAELLLRAYTEKGEAIPPLQPITIIGDYGLQHLLDKAIIISAVDQALTYGEMPISVNTSCRNIRNEQFWDEVDNLLDTHFRIEDLRGNLTFEVTEDDLGYDACRTKLLQLKDKYQCSFALDDFYHDYDTMLIAHSETDSFDWARLDNLRDIVDFVKIDGQIVEECLHNAIPQRLNNIIERVHKIAPHAQFVFERVADAEEALLLGGMVTGQTDHKAASFVQGRRLEPDRETFHTELLQAAHNYPPKPKLPGL